MSVSFAAPRQRGKGEITPAAIQKILDENNHLIQCIMDYQNKGKTSECSQFVMQTWAVLLLSCTPWGLDVGELIEVESRQG
uniref:SS18 subunit of BAF chromatin remodeling complex n=1 Tax=Sphenodon punctatus TaxID=8508 RepID=A0A8D0GXN6_SPHPU